MQFGTDVRHQCQMLLLTFQRSCSKFKDQNRKRRSENLPLAVARGGGALKDVFTKFGYSTDIEISFSTKFKIAARRRFALSGCFPVVTVHRGRHVKFLGWATQAPGNFGGRRWRNRRFRARRGGAKRRSAEWGGVWEGAP